MRIFLIIFDTLRKDHTGKTYGNDWIKTPHFDAFAKDSIIFDKTYPESLPTIPVRRAIHTGLRTFPFNHKRPELRTDDIVKIPGWHPIPPQQTHLAEYMKKQGFISSFITSAYHQFKPNMNFHIGFDQWNWIRGHEGDKFRAIYRQGSNMLKKKIREHTVKDLAGRAYQRRVLKTHFSNVQNRNEEVDYFPGQTFTKAVEFVNDTVDFEKVFCLIDEFDPHEPWDPPQKYRDLYINKNYDGKKIVTPAYRRDIDYLTEEELQYMRGCYAGEISMCDNWFGYFITELKNMELYEESLIILISDHGHSIGEHNATGKIPFNIYPELVDIPLMIKPPGGFNGPKRIKKPYVYDHDILPTIFGFLNQDKPEVFEGIDLSIFAKQGDQSIENRNYVTCGFHAFSLYKDDHYALITSNNRKFQKLFDLSKDHDWNEDISDDNPDICNELFKVIEKDAKGELLMEEESQLWRSTEWYAEKKSSD